jgi:hypothetical protein
MYKIAFTYKPSHLYIPFGWVWFVFQQSLLVLFLLVFFPA